AYEELARLKPIEALATQRKEIERLNGFAAQLQNDAAKKDQERLAARASLAMSQNEGRQWKQQAEFARVREANALSEAAACTKVLTACREGLEKCATAH
ncbi:MAG TPA: hypothetical protein VN181_02180, partial [Thermoanaerobaculia bacterium]|nr:hypothetical protein [Thermoanaerobaculia bacterium]